jgi:energy-converting hydrogenase A subunit R
LGKKAYITDCEGPITLNDNAFELAGHFIDYGEEFFTIVSKYDDILADEVKRTGYNAGDTLKLIVPFLKAYGATNDNITKFSSQKILLIPGASEMLNFINNIMPSFIVSTSYEQYIHALCDLTGFPHENTYSTKLDIDNHSISLKEKKRLQKMLKTIIQNPGFEILDDIFWKDIPQMNIGDIIPEVQTVGGEGKKEAVMDILNKNGLHASDVMYVGDSITDVQPLQYIKNKGGLSISFNGNEYAIREAEVAVISDNATIISILAYLFNRFDKKNVIEFIKKFQKDPESALQKNQIDPYLLKKIHKINLPQISIINRDNIGILTKESTGFRKKVRGEAIGGLG